MPTTNLDNMPTIDQLFDDCRIKGLLSEAGIQDTVILMQLPPQTIQCDIKGFGPIMTKRVTAALESHGLGQRTLYKSMADFLREEFQQISNAPVQALHVVSGKATLSGRTTYAPLRLIRLISAVHPHFSIGQLADTPLDNLLTLINEKEKHGPNINRMRSEIAELRLRFIDLIPDFEAPFISTKPGRGHLRAIS